jgi:hypothetical protein
MKKLPKWITRGAVLGLQGNINYIIIKGGTDIVK